MLRMRDENNVITTVFEEVKGKHFPGLLCLRFLYSLRDEEKFDDEDQLILASVRKLAPDLRDLFSVDVVVEVYEEAWKNMLPNEREKLAYHELLHLFVDNDDNFTMDEEISPRTDKQDRIIFKTVPHDMIMRRFEKELTKFGLTSDEAKFLRRLNDINSLHSAHKDKKLPHALLEDDEEEDF